MTDAYREYIPDATAILLHKNNTSKVKIIKGHVGSGKSTMSCQESFRIMMLTPVCRDGVRRARWLCIRNTYAELEMTTIKTWMYWFPEDYFGRLYKKSPMRQEMKFYDKDGILCEFEVYFVSMDRDEDVKKVLSLELTGFYVNELREIPYSVVQVLLTRLTCRYPSKEQLGLAVDYEQKLYYQCIIADTNAPNIRHWIKDAEDSPPSNWIFYNQPPAMVPAPLDNVPRGTTDSPYVVTNGLGRWIINPDRENRAGSTDADIIDMASSIDEETFKVYVLSEYGSNFSGKPVHYEYSSQMHYAKTVINMQPGFPVYLGWDFGATPAVVVMQLVGGRMLVIDNWQAEWSDLESFLDNVFLPEWNTKYAAYKGGNYISTGDPAGTNIVSHEIQTLNRRGIKTSPAFTNDPSTRRAALSQWLNKNVNGQPGLQVSLHCDFINEGLSGGFMYKKINIFSSGRVKFHEVPDKNEYSHSCEAAEYALMPLYNNANRKELNLTAMGRRHDGTIDYRWG
jgi:hypothetical protein